MTVAALFGLSSGALHAVTGPDHLLSLAPLSLGRRRRAWRVGLLWGLGHALGTLLCTAAVAALAATLQLDVLERWGERLAGLALVVTGVVGLRRWARQRTCGALADTAASAAPRVRGVVALGLVHGITGAAAVLMLLPAAAGSSATWRALYLGGFAFGSTVAMAALTAALAATAGALGRREALLRNVPVLGCLGSVALGGWWALA